MSADWTETVAALAAMVRRDQADLRQAVADAHASGVRVADLATAAGATRQTVYRWIQQETGASYQADLRETLDAALLLLAEIVGDTNRPTLLARARGREIGPKILGMQIGTASLPPGVALDDADRQTITSATSAAHRASQIYERTGAWPERVRVGRD